MDRYRNALVQWRLLRGWDKLIRIRSARANQLGIQCLHVVVPEKLSIYDNMTKGLRYNVANASSRQLAKRFKGNPVYLDLLAPLRASRDGPVPLYQRTDTHWTIDGCLLAYREIMRELGAVPPVDIAAAPRNRLKQVMDLGDKLPDRPSEEVERIAFVRHARRVGVGPIHARYEAEGREQQLHVGAHVIYRNGSDEADPRRLVIFGDSCAHFAPFMLTGLLAESFYEVHFIWSTSLDWAYLENVRPDILLFEVAERFLARLPKDDYDVMVAGRSGKSRRMAKV